MTTPLVSIIMPAYNCEQFIDQAINSIINQTYKNWELLISDDGSKDGTKTIIEKYKIFDSRIKTYHQHSNQGYLKTSNTLLKKCVGEYVTFQDADDFSDPNRLMILINFLLENPLIDCVGSNIIKVSEQGSYLYESNYPLIHSEILENFKNYKVVMTGSSLMVKKKVLNVIGIYNEYFDRIGSEDLYWYSLILQTFQVANVKNAIYFYRSSPGSVSRSHKNWKALIGHDLIIMLYEKSLKTKKNDFLRIFDFKTADVYAAYLYLIKYPPNVKTKFVFNFLLLTIKNPLVGLKFLNKFFRILRTKNGQ